jgi:hypothetical protein
MDRAARHQDRSPGAEGRRHRRIAQVSAATRPREGRAALPCSSPPTHSGAGDGVEVRVRDSSHCSRVPQFNAARGSQIPDPLRQLAKGAAQLRDVIGIGWPQRLLRPRGHAFAYREDDLAPQRLRCIGPRRGVEVDSEGARHRLVALRVPRRIVATFVRSGGRVEPSRQKVSAVVSRHVCDGRAEVCCGRPVRSDGPPFRSDVALFEHRADRVRLNPVASFGRTLSRREGDRP